MRHDKSRPTGKAGGQVNAATTGTSVPRLTAGSTLRAADALRSGQQTFTADQVAYLMHLAYEAGRTGAYLGDLADLYAGWETGRRLRRPEPYSSPENGTTLGVDERDVSGWWVA